LWKLALRIFGKSSKKRENHDIYFLKVVTNTSKRIISTNNKGEFPMSKQMEIIQALDEKPEINAIKEIRDRNDFLKAYGSNVGAKGFVLGISGGQESEEHTSELQSRFDLVCRLLLE